MKKKICVFLAFFIAVITMTTKSQPNDDYNIRMKQDLLSLILGYEEDITGVVRGDNDSVYIVMKSGKKILYDDRRSKTVEEKLNNPDLEDMLQQIYPLESIDKVLEKDFDPGRIRVYPLLYEVYGRDKALIEKNLKGVTGGVTFNKNNKAAEALNNVMKEVQVLARTDSKASSCIYPLNGTYNYRLIAGTGRLSPHGFAIAIDLARNKKDYWKWASLEEGNKRIKEYSKDVPIIFEKNNFVWGGKWNHFDILHYEYRPEIIIKARYFPQGSEKLKPWYGKISLDNQKTKEAIEIIDKALD